MTEANREVWWNLWKNDINGYVFDMSGVYGERCVVYGRMLVNGMAWPVVEGLFVGNEDYDDY